MEAINSSNVPLISHKGTNMGSCSPIVNYMGFDTDVDHTSSDRLKYGNYTYDDDITLTADTGPLLEDGQYDDRYPNVPWDDQCLTDEQLEDFMALLKKVVVFANRPEELTQTDVDTHTIDTRDAIPSGNKRTGLVLK